MKVKISHKQTAGVIAGILIAALILILPIHNLNGAPKKALALIVMTVCFWAFKVVPPGYSSALFLTLTVVTGVAPPKVTFSLWSSHMIYLIIGAYLIAEAVDKSNLGRRIAYLYITKFVSSFRSIIISCFVLEVILALLIPHPWPRAFLILSVMMIVAKSAQLNKNDTAIVGFSVFVGAIPTAMIFLTGDSTINLVAVAISGQEISWLKWLLYMGVPALAASAITCFLIIILFKQKGEFNLDKAVIRKNLNDMGPLSSTEKKTLFWVGIAVLFWVTDSLHGIELGWITMIIIFFMSLPKIGGVIDAKSFKVIPFDTLIFLTAAIAIGGICSHTGLNEFITSALLPDSIPQNIFLFALLITVVTIGLHMCMGSVMAVISIAAPAFVSYIAGSDIPPIVPSLLVYSSVAFHFILPYQHLTVLIGLGDETGKYTDSDVVRLGIPLTIAVFFVTLLVEVPWWKLIGLI